MPVRTVYGQSSNNFNPDPLDGEIRIARENALGSAKYVVYKTDDKSKVFGAGSCPALSAHPPYSSVKIPKGVYYTVQSLDTDLSVDY